MNNLLKSLLLTVSLLLTSLPISYAQNYTIIQLTDNDISDFSPNINDNNQIALSGGVLFGGAEDGEVFFNDGSTTFQITDNSKQDSVVGINNNGDIIWIQSELNGVNAELFLFDGTSVSQLTNTGNDYIRNIDFNDNGFLVWEEYVKRDINAVFVDSFIYNGSTTAKFEANIDEYPNASITLYKPKINNQGQVVLEGRISYGFYSGNAIFLYDGSVLIDIIGLSSWPTVSSKPDINDNGHIVWQSDGEILLYDGSAITQITDNDYSDWEPQINNNGYVVWGSTEGIFLYDGTITTKLSEYGYNYHINDNNYVVWEAREPDQDMEIFLYNVSEVIQITNNDYDDLSPQLNNNNYIVWWTQFPGGQARSEIFLAIPGSPPIAEAGDNVSIGSDELLTTVIYGTASDPDSINELQYRWLEGNNVLVGWAYVGEDGECPLELVLFFPDIGTHVLTLEVTDGTTVSTDQTILTIENSAPYATAYGGGVYEQGTEVTLYGDVSDYDGDLLQYQWLEDVNILCTGSIQALTGGAPVELPHCIIPGMSLGLHSIVLDVDDGVNAPVTNEVIVNITDSSVPSLAPVPNQSILWPPNHKMVDVYIQSNAADNSGLPVTLNAFVVSNEPEDGLGDGDISPDWSAPVIDQEIGLIHLQLRAERSGNGDGRVYTVVITATDASNNSSSASVDIVVPHNKY
jgi:hypothetical protein